MAYDPNHAPYNSKKDTARSLVDYYKRTGELKQKPCRKCGSKDSEAHHKDYNDPKKVDWLCRDCHAKERIGKKLRTAIASTRKGGK